MWNPVREDYGAKKHTDYYIKTLREAMEDSLEYDVSDRPSVWEALEWLEKYSPATWGITLFKQGLAHNEWQYRQALLRQGFAEIIRHL